MSAPIGNSRCGNGKPTLLLRACSETQSSRSRHRRAVGLKTAEQNAKLNGVDNKTELICGNLTDKVSGKFNIVTANIVADVIIMLNNDILKFLDKDGIYIMSGIIDTRENDVLENLKGKFKVLKIIRERGWDGHCRKTFMSVKEQFLGGGMSVFTSDVHTFGTDGAVLLASFAQPRREQRPPNSERAAE